MSNSFAINNRVDPKYAQNDSKGDVPRSGDFINKYGMLSETRRFQELGMTATLDAPKGGADMCIVLLDNNKGSWVINRYVWDGSEWEFDQPVKTESYESAKLALDNWE